MNETLDAGFCSAALHAFPLPLLVADEHDVIVWVNEPLCDLFGTDGESLLGAAVSSVIGERGQPAGAGKCR